MLRLKQKIRKNPLRSLLLITLGVRWTFCFFSNGFEHPNEIYRFLEPIATFGDFATAHAWEIQKHLVSYLPARLFSFFVSFFSTLGLDAAAQALLLRLILAGLSVFQVQATWIMLKMSGASRRTTIAAAATVGLWPEFVYHSARLMDYNLVASLLALSLMATFHWRRPWLTGIFLGLSFFVRFQSGLFLILLMALVSKQGRIKKLGLVVGVYGLTVGALAALEAYAFGGGFLGPFFRYIEFNVLSDGAAQIYGADPWHRYISEAAKYLGILPFLVLVAGCCLPSANRRWVFLFAVPFVIYSFISHKEGRFILGFLWLLVPAGLSAVDGFTKFRFLGQTRRNQWASMGVLFAFAFGLTYQLSRVYDRAALHSDDVLAFTQAGKWMGKMKVKTYPLIVQGDPDFLPGGFFLQHRGPLCYWFERRRGREVKQLKRGKCDIQTNEVLLLSRGRKDFKAKFGTWRLSVGGN